MKTIYLSRQDIHTGALILVNQSYGYRKEKEGPLVSAWSGEPRVLLQRRAAVLLFNLMEEIQGFDSIVPVSGWRSRQEQQEIWDESLKENGKEFTRQFVALPGHSEHQTGLAVDLGLKQETIDFIRPDFPYNGICQKFRERASKYGFIERYPQGKEMITGIAHEPWHFRYVGVPHAAIMKDRNLSLEEYISFIRDFPYGSRTYCAESCGRRIEVSYLEADKRGNTEIRVDDGRPCCISGNNADGFIITQWRNENE